MDNFCAAPWMSLALSNNGATKLCCVHKNNSPTSITNVFTDELRAKAKSVFQANERFPGCIACWEAEAVGHPSIRQQLNEIAEQARPGFRDAPSDGLVYYDLAFGNTCNQKCRMCGPSDSSAWVADMKALGEADFPITSRMDDIPEIISSMKQTSGALWIEVKGGEPFVMPEVRAFFAALEREGLADRVAKMRFMTNGSLYPKHLVSALKRFQTVSIRLSIDATYDVYRYVRGSKVPFEEVDANIARLRNDLPHAHFSVANTVTIQNVFDQVNLLNWARTRGMSVSGKILYRPSYLDLRYLPEDIASVALASLAAYDGPSAAAMRAMLAGARDKTRVDHEMKTFVSFTRKIDSLRMESCSEAIPQLGPLFERYG